MSQTPEKAPSPAFGVVSADQRLALYADYFNESKERQVVREILERDLLIALTHMNQHRIKEYPLIPMQQQAVVEFITLRTSGDNELEEYIHRLTKNFIDCLENHIHAIEVNDSYEVENSRAALLNAESLLIKCVQGVCFTIAVCEDNFIEALQRLFGEFALSISDEIIHEHAMGELYWREHLERIVVKGVKNAFDNIRESRDMDIRKEKQALFLTYSLDSVIKRLRPPASQFGKSQIQLDFEKNLNPARRPCLKAVYRILSSAFDSETSIPAELRQPISQIMCLDSCAGEYVRQKTSADAVKQSFLELQLISVACGAFISFNAVTQDFLRALEIVFPSALNFALQELKDFSPATLDALLLHLIEISFIQRLYDCFGESRSQMDMKAIRFRCLPEASVEKLFKAGLAADMRDKLWRSDPNASGYLLFIPTAAADLKRILEQSGIQSEALAQIIRLWQNAEIKTKFQITIRLDKLIKVTTNLNHRLSLILRRFGVLSKGS